MSCKLFFPCLCTVLAACLSASCVNDDNGLQEERQEWSDYTPLLQEGKMWVSAPSEGLWELREFLSGDTIIGGISYKKLYDYSTLRSNQTSTEVRYRGALREEGMKVYCIKANTSEEQLKYDFGLRVGDELKTSEDVISHGMGNDTVVTIVTVKAIDTIESHGHLLKRLKLSATVTNGWTNKPYELVWVEGVGTTHPDICNSDAQIGEGAMHLVYCEEGGQLMYGSYDYIPVREDKGETGHFGVDL